MQLNMQAYLKCPVRMLLALTGKETAGFSVIQVCTSRRGKLELMITLQCSRWTLQDLLRLSSCCHFWNIGRQGFSIDYGH